MLKDPFLYLHGLEPDLLREPGPGIHSGKEHLGENLTHFSLKTKDSSRRSVEESLETEFPLNGSNQDLSF